MAQNDFLGEDYKYREHLKVKSDYEVTKGVLKIYTNCVYPKFRKWAKEYRFEGDLLQTNTFLKQVRKESYFEFIGPVSIGGKTKWGLALNIDGMTAKGLEICEPWTEQE